MAKARTINRAGTMSHLGDADRPRQPGAFGVRGRGRGQTELVNVGWASSLASHQKLVELVCLVSAQERHVPGVNLTGLRRHSSGLDARRSSPDSNSRLPAPSKPWLWSA